MPPKQQTAIEFGIAVVSARSLPEKKVRDRIASRFSPEETDAAIERLRELRYVNDAAWAERFARDRFDRVGKGRHRIRMDLVRAGIDAETADNAIASVVGADTERESAQRVLDSLLRRASRSARDENDERSRSRVFRQMMSRGFPTNLIRELLKVS